MLRRMIPLLRKLYAPPLAADQQQKVVDGLLSRLRHRRYMLLLRFGWRKFDLRLLESWDRCMHPAQGPQEPYRI